MKKHKVQSKEKAERDKLLYKLKQEKKGALREIRRDASFLGKIKIKAHIERFVITCVEVESNILSYILFIFIVIEKEKKKLKEFMLKLIYNKVNLMH